MLLQVCDVRNKLGGTVNLHVWRLLLLLMHLLFFS